MKFASTMPQRPHEYTLLEWRPDLDREFFAFVALIRTDGVVELWPADTSNPRDRHTYPSIDGWDYWTTGEPVGDAELINRARLDDTSR